eukprot:scaffold49204_cov36-Cyclotella_meneghiniana.AAC.1
MGSATGRKSYGKSKKVSLFSTPTLDTQTVPIAAKIIRPSRSQRHDLGGPLRRVLTSPDSRCEGAQAHTSPALESQKPWRHPPSTMADEIGRISPTTGSLTFPLQPQLGLDPTPTSVTPQVSSLPPLRRFLLRHHRHRRTRISPIRPLRLSAGRFSTNTASATTPQHPITRDDNGGTGYHQYHPSTTPKLSTANKYIRESICALSGQ